MEAWVIWVIAAILFAAIEAVTTTLFFIPFSAGALAAALGDVIGMPLVAECAIFLVVSGGTFLAVRPIARRHRTMPPQIRTGTSALIGREAVVLEDVTRDGGSIKLEGEVWTARSFDEDEVLAAGSRVQVVQIKGATALVTD